jgi:radical SAM-linked protein
MTDPNQQIAYPIMVRFAKIGFARFIGHLDWQNLQQAIFLKAGLKIIQSEGPTHRLRVKTSPPTSVSVESRCELTYLLLAEPVYPDEAKRRLNAFCPEGIEIVSVKDAGNLARKNPFIAIEAANYDFKLARDENDPAFAEIISFLEKIKSENPPDNSDPDEIKSFWGRIIELKLRDESIELLVHQKEGDTFHAAKCADYMQKNLGLAHYPLFTKLDYYRLKPSKRKLFQ